jgi:hypothetical protein
MVEGLEDQIQPILAVVAAAAQQLVLAVLVCSKPTAQVRAAVVAVA